MAVYKLFDDTLEEDSFALTAIHSSLEDYRLVYFLNRYLSTGFSRRRNDLDFNEKYLLPIYEWYDYHTETQWNLTANRFTVTYTAEIEQTSLFTEAFETRVPHYLVPEYKKADYLLKISGEPNEATVQKILKGIKEIARVVTAYQIDINQLKSKKNLIFE